MTVCKPIGHWEHAKGSLVTVNKGTVEATDDPGEPAALGETFPTCVCPAKISRRVTLASSHLFKIRYRASSWIGQTKYTNTN